MLEPKKVAENKTIAYVVPGVKKDVMQCIRPCKITRDWMDSTPARYAYRCIPLTAANSMGWEILNPVDTQITWSGKDEGDQLEIKNSAKDPFSARPHFGSGTVTWYIPFLFRTPANYGLMVTGPANHDKANVTPLDAFIRTDWLPFPFTMNWRLTEAKKTVSFKAGEPICRVIPYPLALLDEMELEIRDLHEDPAFMQQVQQWDKNRQVNYQKQKQAEQQWAQEGRKPELKELWNSSYAKGGKDIAGLGKTQQQTPHQNMFKCAQPVDKRKR